MATWYEIRANYGGSALWVQVCADEKPEIPGTPWLLPDGTDVWDLIDAGRLDAIPYPVWFQVVPTRTHSGTRRGDMLWTTGSTTIVSNRMLAVLEGIGATGYRTFPVDVRDRAGQPLEGYSGFFVGSNSTTTDIKTVFGFPNFMFLANARVVTELTASGVTELSIKEHNPQDYDDIPAPEDGASE